MTLRASLEALADEGPVLVTGAAGFIGFHVARALLAAGVAVVGVDSLTAYYDVALKRARLAALDKTPGFRFERIDLADRAATAALFAALRPRQVIHLAAQAGVRYSLEAPFAYADSNLTGFLSVLEGCRAVQVAHLLYASSSSVYGANAKLPFSARDPVDHPVSLYAATKRANELMAEAYCRLYGFPATGLRFFTVYGPWGRPDMAYWLFAEAIMADRPIAVNNAGAMARDFTHIDDIVEGVLRLLTRPALPDPAFDPAAPRPDRSSAPHRLYNLGNDRPEGLLDMIAIIEAALGRTARKEMRPMPAGDVARTWADIADLEAETGWRPRMSLAEGLPQFVRWWRQWRDL
ncbi:MAG: UDP-glucuronate 5-epimerase [Rhodobacterales bacterium CG_4_9_14_3_um_filter_71_31]|nr:MAG: UDP-glucuronate 5-epimerase [Rhodobacterales bacterium CG_4_9_14_3_um_filter_71_31]